MIEQSVENVIDLVKEWANNGAIAGVICKDSMTKRDRFEEVDNWLYELRAFGKWNCKVQIYFKVQSKLSIPELVKDQHQKIKTYGYSFSTKETREEYTTRISILLGVNLQFVSKLWHHKNIEDRATLNTGIIKLKQDKVYERNYSSICYVVYSI